MCPLANEATPLLFFSSGDKRGRKQNVCWNKRKERWLLSAAASGGDQKAGSGSQSADINAQTVLWLHPKEKKADALADLPLSYKLKWNHLVVTFDVPRYRELMSAGDFRYRHLKRLMPLPPAHSSSSSSSSADKTPLQPLTVKVHLLDPTVLRWEDDVLDEFQVGGRLTDLHNN